MKPSLSRQLIDSSIRHFFVMVIAIQIALLGIIVLDIMGIQLPYARLVVGFIYLTFIPGLLIIRILRIHGLKWPELFAYSMGLSLSFIMFAGATLNLILPVLGILHSISTLSLLISLQTLIGLLCVIAYFRDDKYLHLDADGLDSDFRSAPLLSFLLLCPIVAVLGTFSINNYNSSNLLTLLFLLIAFIVLLITFNKSIPLWEYPLAIYMISISIVLHVSLISSYPYGWNIDSEYYFSNLVSINGYWDSNSQSSIVNSLLSIVMIPPVYSKILGLDICWVFKSIFPFFHAAVPLAIFESSKMELSEREAFISTIFYMSLSGFYISMSLFRREQISLLFLTLVVLVLLDKQLNPLQKSCMIVPFTFSITSSHYATAYLSGALFLISGVLYYIPSVYIPLKKSARRYTSNYEVPKSEALIPSPIVLKPKIMALWAIFMLFWFMYAAGGVTFDGFVNIMYSSLKELLNPQSHPPDVVYEALGAKLPHASILGWAFRVIHYTIELLIATGYLALLFKPRIFNMSKEYRSLTMIVASFLFIAMLLPPISSRWDISRLYNFSLVIISPLIVLGFTAIKYLFSYMDQRLHFMDRERYLNLLNRKACFALFVVIIIVPYFLFSIGFINAVGKNRADVAGVPRSIPLTCRINDSEYFNESEVSGAEWLDRSATNTAIIKGDSFSRDLLSFWFPSWSERNNGVNASNYVYLRTWNIEKQELRIEDSIHKTKSYPHLKDIPGLDDEKPILNKLYNNGGSYIFSNSYQ